MFFYSLLDKFFSLLFFLVVYVYRGIKKLLFCYPCCRFYPSCSSYGVLVVKKFGFFKGFVLLVLRILRCNPFCKGGIDDVF